MLEKYDGHEIVVGATNGNVFRGKVIDYITVADSEDGRDSIVLRDRPTGKLIELYEEDIKTIDIIK